LFFLRTNEYKLFIEDYRKFKKRQKDEEATITSAKKRLQAINKEIKKLDNKLLEA